jgi:hypothetical protein
MAVVGALGALPLPGAKDALPTDAPFSFPFPFPYPP